MATLAAVGAPPAERVQIHQSAALCTAIALPGGLWVPLAIQKGALQLADPRGGLYSVPLRSPALRACLLLCADRQTDAQSIMPTLRPELQQLIGEFAASRDAASDGQISLQTTTTTATMAQSPQLLLEGGIKMPLRARVCALLTSGRLAEAARLLSETLSVNLSMFSQSQSQQQEQQQQQAPVLAPLTVVELCRAVAVAAAAAGEQAVANSSLDLLYAQYARLSVCLFCIVLFCFVLFCFVLW